MYLSAKPINDFREVGMRNQVVAPIKMGRASLPKKRRQLACKRPRSIQDMDKLDIGQQFDESTPEGVLEDNNPLEK